MRGKNIIWLSLMAMLLMPVMVNVASAPANTRIYVDPKIMPTDPSAFGHPGDVFSVSIKVENMMNVWSVGFVVKYAPYGRPLVVSEVKEGDFMGKDWLDPNPWSPNYGKPCTSFTFKIDTLKGELKIGITRYWTYGLPYPPVGASGDGTLATFKFTVVEAGDCDIEIIKDTFLDSNLQPIVGYKNTGGYYHGVTANLVGIDLVAGRTVTVGGTQYINSKAKSYSDVPLLVRTRFDLERLEDGKRLKFYSGMRYLKGWFGAPPIEYLMCNGFTGSYSGDPDTGWGFYEVGDPPYLDAIDSIVDYYDPAGGTGNYIWTNVVDSISGRFDFETYDLSDPDDVLQTVGLEVYMASPPHNPDDPESHWDLDVVARAPGEGGGSAWIGSWCGIPEFTWVTNPQHVGTDRFSTYFPTLLTQAIDEARIRYVSYFSEGGGDMGPVIIDAMRLRLEFSAFDPASPYSAELLPYEDIALDPSTINAKATLVGTYVLTATLEYTLAGLGWMEGTKTKTSTWQIVP